jgi:hypothetical protein
LYISNDHCHPGRKDGTAVVVTKGIQHNHVDLPTWVCVPIGKSEIFLAAVYKSLGRTWIDADISEF